MSTRRKFLKTSIGDGAVAALGVPGRIVLISLLVVGIRSYAQELPDPTRFENAIGAFEAGDRIDPPPEGAIVLTGSSSIARWNDQAAAALAPLTVIPRGFGGSVMHDVLHYLDRVALNYQPRAILIYEGDNDTGIPDPIPVETILDHLREIIDRTHRTLPHARIHVLSVKPSILRRNVWHVAEEVNAGYEVIAASDPLVYYVDVATPLLDDDGNVRTDIFVADGLHLNDLGNSIWGATIKAALMPVEAEFEDQAAGLDAIAERYVHLALAMGAHDGDYVDAYFGPEDWQEAARGRYPSLESIRSAAGVSIEGLHSLEAPADDLVRRRVAGLEKRLIALRARIDIVSGVPMPFDEETRLVYDAVAPDYDAAHFESVLTRLDALLPGDGELRERVQAFQDQFQIPRDRLEVVFDAAINECRRRTIQRIALPNHENFTLEYVTDKPWSGYNWYQGDAYSLIQINTDLPISISRAVDLGCHEGYPGHHTHGTLLERELYTGQGWVEYSVYPLFGPQSLLSEGSANYGIDLAFPGAERLEFERDTLFPLAGLDPAQADAYFTYLELRRQLSYARNEAARDYLDGKISRREAVEWLQRFQLSSVEEAEQSVDFIETYRGYVINYNLGRDLVRAYVEGEGGAEPERRWELFERLISEPMSVADMSQP